jgi:hypothetical protein
VAVYRRTHIINIITTSGPVITKNRGPWTSPFGANTQPSLHRC